jgi:hypothetical protein
MVRNEKTAPPMNSQTRGRLLLARKEMVLGLTQMMMDQGTTLLFHRSKEVGPMEGRKERRRGRMETRGLQRIIVQHDGVEERYCYAKGES